MSAADNLPSVGERDAMVIDMEIDVESKDVSVDRE